MQRSIAIPLTALLLLLLACPLCPSALLAQNATNESQALENTPTPPKAPQTETTTQKVPVSIEYGDSDTLGQRLVLNLRERFKKSRLFRLASGEGRSVQIIFSSREEFQGRPGLSSVYSIVWTFSYGRDVLSNYLDGEIGFIEAGGIAELAETLVARTDQVATQYSYLFED